MQKPNDDKMEKRKRFARLVKRIMREDRITEAELTKRLSWHPDRVRELLNGEMALDRRIKIEVAQALRLRPVSKQPGRFRGSPFETLTDKEVDSLFETDIPKSCKY